MKQKTESKYNGLGNDVMRGVFRLKPQEKVMIKHNRKKAVSAKQKKRRK
jgi:hypothetical protein